eukprot:UN22008
MCRGIDIWFAGSLKNCSSISANFRIVISRFVGFFQGKISGIILVQTKFTAKCSSLFILIFLYCGRVL